MSRQLEQAVEDREAKLRKAVALAVDYGLAGAVAAMGGELLGLSSRFGPLEVLLTLRADFEGRSMVCFVGSSTWSHALVKAQRLAHRNELRWQADRFATPA